MIKQNLKTIMLFAVVTMVVCLFSTDLVDFTYATQFNENVDYKITVNGYQQYTPSGTLLNVSELWYPGMSKDGVLEILNNFGKVKIDNLGIEIKSISDDQKLDSFKKYFKLKIDKVDFIGDILNINQTIVDDMTFEQLSNGGYTLDNPLVSYKSDSTYLRYRVTMDKDAPESLQNITSDIAFTINIVGYDNDKPDPPEKKKKHWAHDCIETLLKHGIIQGYPDGSIKPEKNITRAEAAVLVANALEIDPDMLSEYPYEDKSHPWYRGHVVSGTREGVVEGYLDNTFKPSKYITREEMTALLIRGFEKKLYESFTLPFADNNKVADWAMEYVMIAVEHNVIQGYPDKTFRPKKNITRAEAFTIICKLLDLHHLHEVTVND